MNRIHNNNCDGDHCREEHGEVRVYPLGAGGNLILCQACWAHENQYRYNRANEFNRRYATKDGFERWPQESWHEAKVYESA